MLALAYTNGRKVRDEIEGKDRQPEKNAVLGLRSYCENNMKC